LNSLALVVEKYLNEKDAWSGQIFLLEGAKQRSNVGVDV